MHFDFDTTLAGDEIALAEAVSAEGFAADFEVGLLARLVVHDGETGFLKDHGQFCLGCWVNRRAAKMALGNLDGDGWASSLLQAFNQLVHSLFPGEGFGNEGFSLFIYDQGYLFCESSGHVGDGS